MYAPAGTTQAQADYVFYSQVAAGSLVGYTAGQTLSAPSTKLANFALSRQDRDTAGVPNSTILAIVSGSPIVAPVPKLTNVPLTSPINGADYALVNPPLGTNTVGPLQPAQVQALVAQISNLVNQPANVITAQVGIGQYGLNCPQLERAGYVVPGTYDTYLANNPDQFVSVMSAPGVWTGQNGVNSVQDVLNDPLLQTQIQTEIMQNSYDSLTAAGVIQSTQPNPPSLNTGQVYTTDSNGNGVLQNASSIALFAGEIALSGGLSGIIGNSLSNISASNLVSSLSNVNVTSLINGAVTSVGNTLSSVGNTIGDISTLASTSLDSLGSTITQAASGLTTTIAGDVGALVTNASQFGTAVTSLWANGSNLSGLSTQLTSTLSSLNIPSISSLTDSLGLGTLTTGLTGSLNSLTTNGLNTLTGGLTNSLGSIGTSLTGITGSFSGGALDLAGNLNDLASGALSDATNLVEGSLGNLQDLASGALGSLGSSLDVFGSMSQFSVNFSLLSSDSLVSSTQPAPGYSNTVNRATVDAALTRIIGNPLVPVPQFDFPSGVSLGASADITQAQNILNSIKGTASQLLGGSAATALRTATNVVNNATTQLSTNSAAVSKLFG